MLRRTAVLGQGSTGNTKPLVDGTVLGRHMIPARREPSMGFMQSDSKLVMSFPVLPPRFHSYATRDRFQQAALTDRLAPETSLVVRRSVTA
jgi:hypothetical protein